LKLHASEERGGHCHPLYTMMMRAVWRLARRNRYRGMEIGLFLCSSNGDFIEKKFCSALDLLAMSRSRCLARLQRNTRGILVMPLGTAIGEFFPPLKFCCLDEKHVSKDSTLAEEIAATLVHEAAHAHLYTIGIGYPASLHLRIERLCHRRELWFGKRIGSEAVCERAQEYLQQPDSFWAPEAQKTRWLNTLKKYEITGWLKKLFKYLIERRFA